MCVRCTDILNMFFMRVFCLHQDHIDGINNTRHSGTRQFRAQLEFGIMPFSADAEAIELARVLLFESV